MLAPCLDKATAWYLALLSSVYATRFFKYCSQDYHLSGSLNMRIILLFVIVKMANCFHAGNRQEYFSNAFVITALFYFPNHSRSHVHMMYFFFDACLLCPKKHLE